MKNFPYEGPKNLWEAFTKPVDRYKQNYDRVFKNPKRLKKRQPVAK